MGFEVFVLSVPPYLSSTPGGVGIHLGEGDRTLPKSLLRTLKSLSKNLSSETWFLSGNEEKPVEPRCYRKSIHGYLKKASVHQAHPHALRHTFATTCLQAHCDIKTLSELLGHSDAAVTLKKYVHSDMTRKRREINRVFENF